MSNSKILTSMLAASVGLLAQAPEKGLTFDVEGHATFALPSLTKVTHQRLGGGLGVGVMLPTPWGNDGVRGARIALNANSFPGSMGKTAKTSLRNYQLTGDIYFNTWVPKLSWLLGASLNRWSATNSGSETWIVHPTSSSYAKPLDCFMVRPQEAKGYRGGLRVGFSLEVNRHLSAEAVFQQTELTQRPLEKFPSTTPVIGGRYGETYPVTPSWIQVGARYSF